MGSQWLVDQVYDLPRCNTLNLLFLFDWFLLASTQCNTFLQVFYFGFWPQCNLMRRLDSHKHSL
uniref:Ovule protein n=1 Tax=Schistosoma curassoni TaxID=6186 RepID=A0A183KJY1_9TREM